MAELLVKQQVAKLGAFNVTDAALVALNPATGEILAMVGSADYANKEIKGEVNVAVASRQPGSSIKPITYVTAFQKGWTPGTIIEDVATTFPGNPPYQPRNYDGTFRGKVTARQALAMSLNIPAVKTLQFVGVPAMIEQGRRMGIGSFQDPSKYGLALTLGGGEVRLLDLTSAYGVFANQGKYVPWVSILKVADNQGKVLDQWQGARPQQAVDAGRAYMITSILIDNDARAPAFGANSPLKLTRPAAVKTGTTDDFKDNWTVGYTSQVVTGVWVGNADNAAMRGTTGLTGAAPLWHDFMEYALAPLPVDSLSAPEGLVKTKLLRESGKVWQEGCAGETYEEYFSAGTEPKEKCELPTATPTPTEPPATATPNLEELRLRAQGTQQAELTRIAAAQTAHATSVVATQTPVPTQTPRPAPTAQPTLAPVATSRPVEPTARPGQATATLIPARTAANTPAPTQTRGR